jgi:type IV pilus assembly protein PilF
LAAYPWSSLFADERGHRVRLFLTWAIVLICTALAGCAAPQPRDGRFSDAVTESDRSGVMRRADLRLALARAYLEQGQPMVALDEVKQALALDPESAAGWGLRGVAYTRLGDAARAEASFERALALAPNDADAAHNLGWLLCQAMPARAAGQARAQALFRQALAQPGHAQAGRTWLALALCQDRAGQAAQALQSLEQAAQHAADSPQTLWQAVKLARKLDNEVLLRQLGVQLRERFGRSPQAVAFDRGAWDD